MSLTFDMIETVLILTCLFIFIDSSYKFKVETDIVMVIDNGIVSFIVQCLGFSSVIAILLFTGRLGILSSFMLSGFFFIFLVSLGYRLMDSYIGITLVLMSFIAACLLGLLYYHILEIISLVRQLSEIGGW